MCIRDRLDTLRSDGAAVAAFDITFSKPEVSAAPIQAFEKALQARKKKIERVDPQFAAELQNLAAESSADQQFAAAIQKFGPVVLGNYFLYTESDLRDIDAAVLDAYAKQLSFFSFPQVQSIKSRAAFGKQDFANLIAKYQLTRPLPQGAEANLDLFTNSLGGSSSGTGFFNAPSDTDGIVRTATMVLPYGRSKDLREWDLYGSLDVMTVRAFLGVGDDLVLTYGQNGIVDIQFGTQRRVVPLSLIHISGEALDAPLPNPQGLLTLTPEITAKKTT